MSKHLSACLLTLGLVGLLMASVQGQPNAAIVTHEGQLAGFGSTNVEEEIIYIGFSDYENLQCWACGIGCSAEWDEVIRYHEVRNYAGKFHSSFNGPLYSIVYSAWDSPCDYFAYGITQILFKDSGGILRLTAGGVLETNVCESGLLNLNMVLNRNHQHGPRIECVEPD